MRSTETVRVKENTELLTRGKQWTEKTWTRELGFWIKITSSSQFYYKVLCNQALPILSNSLWACSDKASQARAPRKMSCFITRKPDWHERSTKTGKVLLSVFFGLVTPPVEFSWVPGPGKVFKLPRSPSEIVLTDAHCPARTMLHGVALLWPWTCGHEKAQEKPHGKQKTSE